MDLFIQVKMLADHFNLPLLVEQRGLNSPQSKTIQISADRLPVNNAEKSGLPGNSWNLPSPIPMAGPQKTLCGVLAHGGEQMMCIFTCHVFPGFCLALSGR